MESSDDETASDKGSMRTKTSLCCDLAAGDLLENIDGDAPVLEEIKQDGKLDPASSTVAALSVKQEVSIGSVDELVKDEENGENYDMNISENLSLDFEGKLSTAFKEPQVELPEDCGRSDSFSENSSTDFSEDDPLSGRPVTAPEKDRLQNSSSDTDAGSTDKVGAKKVQSDSACETAAPGKKKSSKMARKGVEDQATSSETSKKRRKLFPSIECLDFSDSTEDHDTDCGTEDSHESTDSSPRLFVIEKLKKKINAEEVKMSKNESDQAEIKGSKEMIRRKKKSCKKGKKKEAKAVTVETITEAEPAKADHQRIEEIPSNQERYCFTLNMDATSDASTTPANNAKKATPDAIHKHMRTASLVFKATDRLKIRKNYLSKKIFKGPCSRYPKTNSTGKISVSNSWLQTILSEEMVTIKDGLCIKSAKLRITKDDDSLKDESITCPLAV